jgi:hypothetical protein
MTGIANPQASLLTTWNLMPHVGEYQAFKWASQLCVYVYTQIEKQKRLEIKPLKFLVDK